MAYPTFNITGTAYWASVQKDFPNTKFTPQWQIDVCNLTDEQVAELEKQGIGNKVKERADQPERGKYITIKQKTHILSKGQLNEARPPEVKDKDNREFTDLIGNGSKVMVKYQVRKADDPRYTGVDLQSVQVLELVEYTKDDNDNEVDLDSLPLTAAG